MCRHEIHYLMNAALAAEAASNMAATTFEDAPDFFNSTRSESESWSYKLHV